MIHYITGELVAKGGNHIIIENGGIGFEIWVPGTVLEAIPTVGERVQVYTYFHVKEDGMKLYGFLSPEDKELFQQLITVSGIGPKGGLAIMSTLRSDEIRFAIVADDAKTIAKAPGIGAKTAKKLILELKDKIDMEEAVEDVLAVGEAKHTAEISPQKQAVADAVGALIALGYAPADANRAVGAVPMEEGMTVETLLKQSLRNL